MRNVVSSETERFLAEMNKPQKKMGLWGMILIPSINDSIDLSEENVITDSLCITEQFTGGEFCFGSVSSMELTIGIKGLKQTPKQLANSIIILYVTVEYEDGTSDLMEFPQFYVDGSKIKYSGNVTTLVAYDEMRSIFDKAIETEIPEGSVFDMFEQVILGAGAEFSMTREQIEAFPNGNLTVAIDTAQIQTYRDALMWLCELTNTFARCGSYGAEHYNIEIIRMEHYDPENNLLPQNVIEIKGDVRFNTSFSDSYIRPTTVVSRRKGKLFSSKKTWISGDVIYTTVELNNNPLLKTKTDDEYQTALDNIVDDLQHYKCKPYSATYAGNPAIQCGDCVVLTGGTTEKEGKAKVIGIVTYHKWKFRGKCKIECKVSTTMGDYVDPASTVSTFSSRAISRPISVLPKSQTEKRIDALEAALGGDYLTAPNGNILKLSNNSIELCKPNGDLIEAIQFDNGDCGLDIVSFDNHGNFKGTAVLGLSTLIAGGWQIRKGLLTTTPLYRDTFSEDRSIEIIVGETGGAVYLECNGKRIYFS